MVVGSKNKVKGNIKFEGLIRIEGSVEGQLVSSHDVSQLSTKQQLIAVMTVTSFIQQKSHH